MRVAKALKSKRSRRSSYAMEAMEKRQLFSATISVAQSLMVFNSVSNGGSSPVETLTVTNTGDAALSLNGLGIVDDPNHGGGSSKFSLVNAASAPASLAVGGSFGLQVQYAASSVGLDYALLQISTSDPVTPVDSIQLHGIGTAGLGGTGQPSLERILQAYNEPNYANVGESDPNNALYPEPPASGSDEVSLQELVKAGAGPVTINVLASFTASSTKPYTLGYYNVSNPSNTQQQLFYTPTSEYQSVYVQPQGLTSFDPGSMVFGFYNPSATVRVNGQLVTGHSQDALNTWDTTDSRKFRFFPLLDANNNVVPNSYIMTSTEWYNPTGYDFTNLVAIISNVTAAPSAPGGPVLSVTNPDALPGSNALLFNRIQNPNTVVGDTVHDTNTITLENTGQGSLTISNITVASTTSSNGGTQYQLINPPAFPFTLTQGQTQTISVQFILSQVNANSHSYNETNSPGSGGGGSDYPGVLTITSNDANAGTTTIPMSGWWQTHSENENEPDLQTIINLMAGYTTDINPSLVNYLVESTSANSSPVYYGEEVVSAYWAEADPSQPVNVTQVAAFHTQGDTSGLNYYAQGTNSVHSILNTGSDVGQTFFPLNSAGTGIATGSFTTTGSFGFEELNPNAYSDDAKNPGDDGGGHMFRFYPARDSSGNLIPNTYFIGADYPNGTAENFDFQDNLYLVTNIRPTTTTTVSAPQSTAGAAAPANVSATQVASGISVQWVPVIDSSLSGYNIYSSLSATTGYALLNSSPVVGTSYIDATALPGQTIYYRVAAVNSAGIGLGVQVSVATSGTASTNLQTLAIGETPTGSTTTLIPNQAYSVMAGGPGVTGTSDGFRYIFTAQSGNFDVAVQVNSITVAGNFSTAGIMARDSLSASGANVYMSASPTNYRFKFRSTDGGTESVTTSSTTLTYPSVWVRLARVGNVFTAYTSPEGVVWTLMGSETLANFPTICYLGLAVAANTTTSTTTAQLTNYGPTPVYTGPVAIPQYYSVVSGQTVQEPVLTPDVDLTGTILPNTFLITTPPNAGGNATFDPSTGLLTYTSAAGFIGTETLSYTVADSNGALSAPTLITFNVLTSGPIAAADTFNAIAGQLAHFNVLANDTDATGTLNPASVTILGQPASGATITVNSSTGMLTYISPTSFSGTDTFTYTVADFSGQISAAGTVTVNVTPSLSGGIITSPIITTAFTGKATIIDVLDSDTDSSGAIVPTSVVIVQAPDSGGKTKVNSDGTITYTSLSTFVGTETFLYTVKDSTGATSAATLVAVTVSKPIVAPVASNSASYGTVNGSLSIDVSSHIVTDTTLNFATLAVATGPKYGSAIVDTTTGLISYTPIKNFVGPDTFTYTVTDANGFASNVATVTVNVGVTIGSEKGDDRSVTFTSASGGASTLVLNHGSVDVLFSSAATLSMNGPGVAVVKGSNMQIKGLQFSDTTAASTLVVSTARRGALDIEGITNANPMKAILAPAAVLSGAISLNGIATLQVSHIGSAQISIGTGAPGVFVLNTGAVSNTTLSSAVPIRSIKVTSWSGSSSSISAPSIGTMAIAGNFQASVTLSAKGTALSSAQIKGTMNGNNWNISGAVGTIVTNTMGSNVKANIAGSLNSLTVKGGGVAGTLTAQSVNVLNITGSLSGKLTLGSVKTMKVAGSIQNATLNFITGTTSIGTLTAAGSITGTTINTVGSVGTITAPLLNGDTFIVGAAPGTTLGTAAVSNLGSSRLGTLRLTAHGAVTFSDTVLIVHTLTTAALGSVDTADANGVALASAGVITGSASGKAFRFTSANTTSASFGGFGMDLITAS